MPRLNIELTVKQKEKLEKLSRSKGVSMREILRRALALYDTVDERLSQKPGTELAIVDENQQFVIGITGIR